MACRSAEEATLPSSQPRSKCTEQLTIEEREEEEESTDAVPSRLSQYTILVNLLQDSPDDAIQFVETTLAVYVTARFGLPDSHEADRC